MTNVEYIPNIINEDEDINWDRDFKKLIEVKNKMLEVSDKYLSAIRDYKTVNLYKLINKINTNNFINISEPFFQGVVELIKTVYDDDYNLLDRYFTVLYHPLTFGSETTIQLNKEILELMRLLIKIYEKYKNKIPTGTIFNKIFIPVHRGMKPKEGNVDEDFYKDRFLKDYIRKVSDKGIIIDPLYKSVFTGLSMHSVSTKLLLGGLKDREFFHDFELFLKKQYFSGQEITLIPHHDEDVLSIKIGDEKEQPIFDLGDGLQSLIILTFPLFQHLEENNLVFIEEPEVNMHPGFQRKFIESLSDSKFDNCQFFIVTHSNHLLDLTVDQDNISVFTSQKFIQEKKEDSKERLPKFFIQNVSNGDYSTLQILGVQNSSVFLSNTTIWVEGYTDRFYLRKFLELYMNQEGIKIKKYYEDLNFSFIEYSGNNITHWSFLDEDEESDDIVEKRINFKRISQNIFLITDKDKKKEKRQQKLKEYLGEENYYCFEATEIENTFKKEIIIEIVRSHYNETEKKLIDSSKKLQLTEESTYKDNKLGKLLFDKLGNEYGKKFFVENGSGTIKNKKKFCEIGRSLLTSFDDLSEEQKALTIKIYKFIEKHNEQGANQ